jgi:hypothetical protein
MQKAVIEYEPQLWMAFAGRPRRRQNDQVEEGRHTGETVGQ